MPELTLRDGMVILGSLLILAVAVDAWRRMRHQQRSRVRVKLASELPGDDPVDDLSHFRELPNGGARVVPRDERDDCEEPAGWAAEAHREREASDGEEPSGVASHAHGRAAEEDADPGSVGDTVSRMPGGALQSGATSIAAPRRVEGMAVMEGDHGPGAGANTGGSPADAQDDPVASETAPGREGADSLELDESDPGSSPLAGVRASDDEPANLDWLEDLPPASEDVEDSPGALPRQPDTEVIILHVMARGEGGFRGADILEILLACDLRFGDMNFFHRHEQQAGRGPIQFSVANMLQPGVFDIDDMESMRTRGLVFFLTLPGPEDMIFAFDCMLETARSVARNLGGDLLDESRSVLTQQAVEHSRQQIRELDRRLRAHGA